MKTKNIFEEVKPWYTARQFIQLGIYSERSFYRKAPKGEIAGAFKIGKKWFIDIEEFKNACKP